jgi:hypothetical protein
VAAFSRIRIDSRLPLDFFLRLHWHDLAEDALDDEDGE